MSDPKRLLKDLRVHFISLVGDAANRRDFLVKSAGERDVAVEKKVSVLKTDDSRRMVYGIVYAPDEPDTDGDVMRADEIEKAAYGFMQNERAGQIDTRHSGEAGAGYVAESWLVKSSDALFGDEPEGSWAVGIKVTDDEVWKSVEEGELTGLSLAGLAEAEALSKDADTTPLVDENTPLDVLDDPGPAPSETTAEAFVSKVRGLLGVDKEEEPMRAAPPEDADEGAERSEERADAPVAKREEDSPEEAYEGDVFEEVLGVIEKYREEQRSEREDLNEKLDAAVDRLDEIEKQTGGRRSAVRGNDAAGAAAEAASDDFPGVRIV
jgi:hypothetical protein